MTGRIVVTSASHPTGPLETYSYDPVGNRQTDATASYSYDAANRLLSRGGVGYTWDANGNLTSKKVPLKGKKTVTITYRYDGDNRLLEVQRSGSTIARFTYDPFGRRVSKTTATGTVYYVYDGEDILAEVDAAGNLLTYYVHGPGIDEPLAMIRGTNAYHYHADALGTITHLTNSTGAVVQSYEYDSFGNLVAQSGSLNQPYTYTAREWDTETGLYYYRARYYDPQVGRFITEDPIGQAGGMNLYSYVWNNPISYYDPNGVGPESIPPGNRSPYPGCPAPTFSSPTNNPIGGGVKAGVDILGNINRIMQREQAKRIMEEIKNAIRREECKTPCEKEVDVYIFVSMGPPPTFIGLTPYPDNLIVDGPRMRPPTIRWRTPISGLQGCRFVLSNPCAGIK